MAKDKERERKYKEEGRRRILIRQANRKKKYLSKLEAIEMRKQSCCQGNANCNGTTDCMWY